VLDVKRRGLGRTWIPRLRWVCRLRSPSTSACNMSPSVNSKRRSCSNTRVYGTAIVMNPYNGEILALANYPTYDPNKVPQPGGASGRASEFGCLRPFEPGSIYKVVTLSRPSKPPI